jgi:membrane protein EpsK
MTNLLDIHPEEVKVNTQPVLSLTGARKRFTLNISSNLAFIFVQAIATLWLTPFLIHHLGVAVFGMIPLINVITSYMGIFTTSLNSSVSRFLAIDLEQKDTLAANRTFNTALFGVVGVICIMTPIVIFLIVNFPVIFNSPQGWEEDTIYLFTLVAAGFYITVIGSNFSVSPYIFSQFVHLNIVNILGVISRIGLIVILFLALQPRLWYAGMGTLTGAIVAFIGFLILWRKFTPILHISIHRFDISRLRSLLGMSLWVFVNLVGAMLLGRVDLIVVNAYFGAVVMGGYSTVVQFPLIMEYLVTAVGNVLRPIILIKFSQRDFSGLKRLTIESVKLLGLALALPVGLLCGFSRSLLMIWLGPEYTYLSVLIVIIVFHLSLNLSTRPMLHVQNAFNKVRWPGIITLISGLANVVLAVVFAKWGKFGYLGVAISSAIVWTIKNSIFMPIYTSRIMNLSWWTFLPPLFPGLIGTIIVGIASYGLSLIQSPTGWLELIGSALFVSISYFLVVWVFGLDHDNKKLIYELLPMKLSRDIRSF